VPATRMKKTGGEPKPHLVPLTDDMVKLLESIPRFSGATYVFSADGGRNPIRANALSKPKERLDNRILHSLRALARRRGDDPKRVTLPDWVNHDLRRTVRSNLSALRIAEEVREGRARPGRALKELTTFTITKTRSSKRSHFGPRDCAQSSSRHLRTWSI
jgi:hypothetical protein